MSQNPFCGEEKMALQSQSSCFLLSPWCCRLCVEGLILGLYPSFLIMRLCVQECWWHSGVRTPGAGVTGSCELRCVGAQLKSSARAVFMTAQPLVK